MSIFSNEDFGGQYSKAKKILLSAQADESQV